MLRTNREAAAETIENNVRRKIIKSHLLDPAFYEKMSALLDEIIRQRKAEAIAYEEYLQQIANLARQVQKGMDDGISPELDTPGKRALFNNLMRDMQDSGAKGAHEPYVVMGTAESEKAHTTAIAIDAAVRVSRPDRWRGHPPRENVIKKAMYEILGDETAVERLFLIIKEQKEY